VITAPPAGWAAAALAGISVGMVSWRLISPRRGLLRRFAPYTEVSRSRLGGQISSIDQPVLVGEAARRILGPMARGVLTDLARLLGLADGDQLELRLRRAGMPMDVASYRSRHLRWVIGAPLALGSVGVLLGSAELAVCFFVAGLFAGVRRMPDELKRATARRSLRLRSDLPTVAGILSPRIENRKSLLAALAEVVEQGSGPVVEDLGRGLNLIAAGYTEEQAFNLLAQEADEEMAKRFYRFLAAAARGGIDLSRTLLEHANAMRLQRREEVERSAAKRQMSMVLPDLVFMAPVLLLFLLAPVPTLLFGGG
jgi:tight adherence protein C